MPITIFDGVVLVIVLISALLAMVRGFVREVLSIISWIVALLAAFYLYPYVMPVVQDYVGSKQIALAASFIGLFFLALLIVSYVTMRISDFVLDSRAGALDRSAGFIFGAARGLLIVVIAMVFLNWFLAPEAQPDWISLSKTVPFLNSLGTELQTLLPEDLADQAGDLLGRKVKGE